MNREPYAVCIMVAGVLHFYCQDAVPDGQSNYRTTDKARATRYSHEEALKLQAYLGAAYDIIRVEPYTKEPCPGCASLSLLASQHPCTGVGQSWTSV